MSVYAIGDVQGCYDPLQRLLDHIQFDPAHDRLWFVGDLINRGADSLKVLKLVTSLKQAAMSVLGNHDLHLLAIFSGAAQIHKQDTLVDILDSVDCAALCQWLRQQPLLHYEFGYLLVHAGLPPQWDLLKAQQCALELETILKGENYREFFANMYGNEPHVWQDSLSGWARLRYIANALTRIRFCNEKGELNFSEKGDLVLHPNQFLPWFKVPNRKSKELKIIFGHWAALANQWQEVINIPNIFPVDSGCVWGNCLSAFRIEDGCRFSVKC